MADDEAIQHGLKDTSGVLPTYLVEQVAYRLGDVPPRLSLTLVRLLSSLLNDERIGPYVLEVQVTRGRSGWVRDGSKVRFELDFSREPFVCIYGHLTEQGLVVGRDEGRRGRWSVLVEREGDSTELEGFAGQLCEIVANACSTDYSTSPP